MAGWAGGRGQQWLPTLFATLLALPGAAALPAVAPPPAARQASTATTLPSGSACCAPRLPPRRACDLLYLRLCYKAWEDHAPARCLLYLPRFPIYSTVPASLPPSPHAPLLARTRTPPRKLTPASRHFPNTLPLRALPHHLLRAQHYLPPCAWRKRYRSRIFVHRHYHAWRILRLARGDVLWRAARTAVSGADRATCRAARRRLNSLPLLAAAASATERGGVVPWRVCSPCGGGAGGLCLACLHLLRTAALRCLAHTARCATCPLHTCAPPRRCHAAGVPAAHLPPLLPALTACALPTSSLSPGSHHCIPAGAMSHGAGSHET